MEISFLDVLPEQNCLNSDFSLVVDALFGFSFVGPPRPQFAVILDTLKVRQELSDGTKTLCEREGALE